MSKVKNAAKQAAKAILLSSILIGAVSEASIRGYDSHRVDYVVTDVICKSGQPVQPSATLTPGAVFGGSDLEAFPSSDPILLNDNLKTILALDPMKAVLSAGQTKGSFIISSADACPTEGDQVQVIGKRLGHLRHRRHHRHHLSKGPQKN
jgi:hypothetical protein